MTKQEIRSLIQAERQEASPAVLREKSFRIAERIFAADFWKNACEIWLFISKEGETDTSFYVDKALSEGRRIAAPRVQGTGMDFYYINGYEDLQRGKFGILEPGPDCLRADNNEATILIPGLAFDTGRRRIGWGGGYYDRYLSGHPFHPTCAPAFEFSIFPEIPAEEHDIRPDMIITERRCIC